MLLGSTGAMSRVSTSGMSAATSMDEGPDGWKLKTSFGLVYDFPDTASLLAWLSAREELTGYELAKEGQAFKPLGEYGAILGADIRAKVKDAAQDQGPGESKAPQAGSGKAVGLAGNVKRSSASSASSPNLVANKTAAPSATSGKDSGAVAPVSRSVSPVNLQTHEVDIPKRRKRSKTDAELQEQQRDQQDTRNIVIFSIVILLAVMTVVGLQFSGVVNFRELAAAPPAPEAPKKAGRVVPKAPPSDSQRPPAQPGNVNTQPPQVLKPKRPGDDSDPVGVATGQHNEHVKMLLKQASDELRRKKTDDALRTLSSARAVAPTEPAVYKMLEQVYKKKGDSASAKQMRERYQFFLEQAKRQQNR